MVNAKIPMIWKVTAIIKDKQWKEKNRYESKNTIVLLWQDHVIRLLSKSFVLSQPHDTIAPFFVDYMSIWAWAKLSWNSVSANEIFLPRDPKDWSEWTDYFDWCVVSCVSWANQWEVRNVTAWSYNNWTRRLEVDTPFSNVPLSGEVYTISASLEDNQLLGENEEDANGDVIANPMQEITMKQIKNAPNINEVEIRAEWPESDGDYIVGECWLRYDLSAATPGDSSSQTQTGKLFAKAPFLGNVPVKSANDILEIRRTLRMWAER